LCIIFIVVYGMSVMCTQFVYVVKNYMSSIGDLHMIKLISIYHRFMDFDQVTVLF
jgi:hypothetical protein